MSQNGNWHPSSMHPAPPWPVPDPSKRQNFNGYPHNFARVLAMGRAINLPFEKRVAVAEQWLTAQRCVLWQNWDVTREAGLRDAAEWLVRVHEEFTGALVGQA